MTQPPDTSASRHVASPHGGPDRRAQRVRDLLLIGLTVSSGAVDAISWLALGRVFSAFMTGNLAFAGFALAQAGGPALGRVLAALVAFAIGAGAAARLIGRAELTGVWPPAVTRALAVVLLVHVAFVVSWWAVDARPSSSSATALIAISAFAMGMQTTTVFALGVRASFTTAATATIAVLMGDTSGWSLSRPERVRLTAVIAGVVAGALLGALLIGHAPDWAPLLPSVLLLLVILGAQAEFGGRRARVAADPAT
jgi:uncharacterized membrane protein YoaK (UPF0700 family)